MHTHPNARLTPIGQERLIRQHLDEGRSHVHLAADHGISERTARKWLARFRSGGLAALADRLFADNEVVRSLCINNLLPISIDAW
ncbi:MULTISPECIES: leucine zipper domain-containing protein [unclassified Synechococcus]|uniref:helix-turn-helix domain-containing protein n=1 Tax=Synechococcales TaxID=1890424 RepID=UPI0021020FBD|nr:MULTISPECIES: leucine zipper domain-containing protein [unclassified Synechococcus]